MRDIDNFNKLEERTWESEKLTALTKTAKKRGKLRPQTNRRKKAHAP